MARSSAKARIDWYRDTRPRYESLAAVVAATLDALLRRSKIEFLSVTHRAKSVDSFAEKLRRKRYSAPQDEMTDLAGIRVITYIERDTERVAELVRNSFIVHTEDSGDKSEALAANEFGYRSIHFVCDMGEKRTFLPEFSAYAGMNFEIQVRTALQHAWAEIEHDRSYKFAGELPAQLRRRFHLVAGLLELADREFNVLTEEIERYSLDVGQRTKAGDLNIEISNASVTEFFRQRLVAIPQVSTGSETEAGEKVIAELRAFGVNTLAELEPLFNSQFLEGVKRHFDNVTQIGLIRDAMMYEDIDRYFAKSWNNGWTGWDEESYSLLVGKYGSTRMRSVRDRYELAVLPSEPGHDDDHY